MVGCGRMWTGGNVRPLMISVRAGALPRAAAQMLLVSVGVSMAWIQTQQGVLDRLAQGRIAAVMALAICPGQRAG